MFLMFQTCDSAKQTGHHIYKYYYEILQNIRIPFGTKRVVCFCGTTHSGYRDKPTVLTAAVKMHSVMLALQGI